MERGREGGIDEGEKRFVETYLRMRLTMTSIRQIIEGRKRRRWGGREGGREGGHLL